jgi:acyl-coenzyme A synthetase/AMP-(fatty) acid ligase
MDVGQMRLFDNLREHGDAPALIDEQGAVLTYGGLSDRAESISSEVEQRSLVFCFCTNTVESVTGYVALTGAGHVCLMLSDSLGAEKVDSLITTFRPNLLWCPADADNVPDLPVIAGMGTYQLRLNSGIPLDMHPDLSVLMSTSGSTGSPLMVRQSRLNLAANATSIVESLSLTAQDRALTTLPMNYTYGLSIVNSQLHCGGSLVVTEATLMDRRFWDLVGSSGATYFGGVPYTYEMLSRIGVKKLKDSSLRMLTQAGGRLKPELVESMHDQCSALGIDFVVMYGQTEATARMSVLQCGEIPGHSASIGKPVPGGAFRVVDLDEDIEVPSGETGELEFSGPNVTMGYASGETDLSRGDERGGALRTGDLARVDDDGFFYIVGRRKRFVKLFGHRTNLDDVEHHLGSLGYEVACTGSDDRLQVNVVGDVDEQELLDATAAFVSTNKKAITVKRLEVIPRSDAGKVLYSAIETD